VRKFREVFSLEMKSLVRSKALALLSIANVVWMFAFPYVMKGDGTADGAHELCVRYSLGGAFALTLVALLSSATGSLARERARKRLQLTLVRPVSAFSIALGKMAAHVAAGALVLALACGALAVGSDCGRPCNHVLAPVLPSAREEAKLMYDGYLKDPQTPEAVRKASPQVVLRILEQRAIDHFQVVGTNETATWRFGVSPETRELSVRMRFTNQYEMRQDVVGTFSTGECWGAVSNITQAVISVPLSAGAPRTELTFANQGKTALMLRPRRDIHLLVPADAFGFNLIRSYVVLVAILAFVIAAGVFLSAGLSRPVALFVAVVTLLLGEMSPSVIEQYPNEIETNAADRIGLALTRFAVKVTRPVSSVSPLEPLSKDECVEPLAVGRIVLTDLVALPLALAFVAAFLMPRKPDDQP